MDNVKSTKFSALISNLTKAANKAAKNANTHNEQKKHYIKPEMAHAFRRDYGMNMGAMPS